MGRTARPALFRKGRPAPETLARRHPADRARPGPGQFADGIRASRTAITAERLSSDLGRPVEVFNFGVAAAGPVTQWLYLRRLLGDGAAPDLVLVEVLPPFFAANRPRPAEADWLEPTRLRPGERALAARYGFDLTPHDPRAWARRLAPWHAYRCALLREVAPGCLPGGQRLDRGRGRGLTDLGDTSDLPEPIPEALRRRGIELTRRAVRRRPAQLRPGGRPAARCTPCWPTARAAWPSP